MAIHDQYSRPVYLFAGNGLTEGVYGESYVERIARVLYHGLGDLQGDAVNAGAACDTVQLLLKRLDALLDLHHPDWVVLAVGGNDVWLPWLSGHSLGWWLWYQFRRGATGLRATGDVEKFSASYRMLIDRVRSQSAARVLACTMSPLGERLDSPANRQLARLNGAIKHVAVDRQVPVADVWQSFVEELAPLSNPSGFLPREWLITWLDRRRLQSTPPDEIARRRRLNLTFDGIHLNSRGADIWAATILAALARENLPGSGSPLEYSLGR